MATFTITATSAYENLTGSAGNDTYNINGGTLTIKTDTRYCSNHTENTGNIGNVTISTTLGGNFIIDGTSVRLIPYNTGSGNVPAFGTTISQGGVSSTLCGVWSALNVSASTSGTAMPTSGYIKVIDKTGGNFAAGALTGIGATATGADVTGWIEVVGIEGTTLNVPRLGSCVISGDWYYASNTTGSSASTYQLPASLANTFYPGVWIETSASSEQYEFYPNAGSINATACPSDVRGKICWISSQGLLRLGTHNGTNAGGFLPSSGLKIRVPNIITVNAVSTTMTANAVPNSTLGTRYDFTTTNAGVMVIDKANLAWYPSIAQPYSTTIKNTGIMDSLNISEHAAPLDIDNVGVGVTNAVINSPLVLASCFAGGEVKNSKFARYSLAGSGNYVNSISNINGVTFKNNWITTLTNKANATTGTWTSTNASNCKFYDNTHVGGRFLHATSVNCHVSGTKYADIFNGSIPTTYTHYMNEFTIKSNNCITEFETLLLPSSANAHPYGGIMLANASDYITIRNIGTSASPLVYGTTNSPAYAFASTGNSSNIKAQRVYVQNTRTFLFGSNNADSQVFVDNCHADYADSAQGITWLNARVRGVGCNITANGQTSVYGSHWVNCFTSTTQGRVNLLFNEKTSISPSNTMYTILSGSPKFTSTGGLYMPSIGDSIEYEMDYFALGYTAFQNTAPTMGGGTIGNYTIEYQIKTSGDYSALKTLNAANLSSETITPSVGFKLKIRITTSVTNSTAMTGLNIFMTTTSEAQYTQYPLEILNPTLTFTDIVSGSEIRIYAQGTTTELTGVENSTTSFSYQYEWTGTDIPVDIVIFNVQYQPVYYYNYQLTSTGATIPLQQIFDRNYLNG